MKILCFADTRFPIERANGVQTMATCHALASRGHEVTLVVRADTVTPPRDPFEFYALRPVPTLTIEQGSRESLVHSRKKIPGFFQRARYLAAAVGRVLTSGADVVFTRDLGVAAALLQAPRIPLVYEAHGVSAVVAAELPRLLGRPELAPSPRKLRRLDARDARVWRHAAAYVTITRALADDLQARYGPRDRLMVVPDGARASRPSADRARIDAEGPVVAAYAGHLYPWKGVDVFVHAIARVPGVHGVIVGGHPAEADFERIQHLIHALHLGERLTMTGLVSPADVARHLSRASMLILPNTRTAISERYTSPLKLFEYLAAGRPIVASDLPAIREVLAHERTALLVPPDDPDALAGAMSRLANDHPLASSLADAAAALAPDYTWERRAERLEAALFAAVDRRS